MYRTQAATSPTASRTMLATLPAVGALTVAAPGAAHAGESCHKINAKGSDHRQPRFAGAGADDGSFTANAPGRTCVDLSPNS